MNFEKKHWLILLIAFFLPQIILAEIIPTPQKHTYKEGEFKIVDNIRISLTNDTQSKNLFAAELLTNTLKNYLQITSYLEMNPKSASILLVFIDETRAKAINLPSNHLKDGYRLLITPEKIQIEAVHPQGVFYAITTLVQLIEESNNNNKTIKAQEILDWPELAVRGISDDIAHGQVSSLANFKKIIQQIARYKMNTYMLYVEDMIQLDQYPEIGRGKGALTKKEVRELVDFAQKHFVEIIPVFETLSHQENILAIENLQSISEFPGSNALCTSCETTYKYLENALREIIQIFPSNFIHIGGGGSPDTGIDKSKIQVMQVGGIANLYATHYKRVYNTCKKYNKQVIMYSEMLLKYPEILKQIPKDIILVDYQAQSDTYYPSVEIFKKAGFKYYLSPATNNSPATFPVYSSSIPNIYELSQVGIENQAQGLITANSNLLNPESLKELLYYDYAWTAQCSWNNKGIDIQHFNNLFFANFFGTQSKSAERVYRYFMQPFNQISWVDFWRHPLLAPKKSVGFWHPEMSATSKILMMEWDTLSIRQDLDSLKKTAKNNTDQVAILSLTYELNNYYLYKLRTHQELNKYAKYHKGNTQELIAKVEANILQLEKLRTKFQEIWNQYYRPEGWDLINKKFTRLINYFEEVNDNLIAEKLPSPLIKSQWIYTGNDSLSLFKEAIFHKDITLKEIPEVAQIQFLADTYAELHVNGNFVAKIFVRNTNSPSLEYQISKIVSIKDFLKEGENTIEFKTINYNQGLKNTNSPFLTSAGVNATIFLRGNEGETYIYSDKTWKAKLWNLKNLSEPWKVAFEKPYPYEIIAPNFQSERISWTER